MTKTSQSARPDVISLADEERVNDVILGAVLGLWHIVNNLTRLRPSRRDRYRVTMFGSARATPGSFAYEETKRAAAMLASPRKRVSDVSSLRFPRATTTRFCSISTAS